MVMARVMPFNRAQAKAFPYADKHPYSILALDPRLGKSRVAIEVREKYQNNCLIICPGHLVLNWKKEILKWGGKKSQILAVTKGKQIYDICDTDYAIVSFDLAKKAENFFDWADMVVIDEGHYLKSMEAQRTTFIHKCIFEYAIPRLHILTGTPIKNRVKEFYSLLALMNYDPRVADSQFLDLYPSELDFADQFAYREKYQIEIKNKLVTVMNWKGLKNLPELKKHLHGKYLRIKARDGDLPPIDYKPILISETPDKTLLAAFDAYFAGDDAGSVKSQYKKEAALRKTPFTIKYAKDLLEERECCLIYSDHVDSAEAIAQTFGVRALTGKVSAKMRGRLADKFQSGEGRVLVATIGALKEGRDLFRANDIIMNDFCWVPGDLKQVINRVRAVGKTTPCLVHEIHGSPQDEYITNTLKEKIDVIERAT